MEKKLLKNGLFGYSKTSVCEYIAEVNEEFSRRLLEANEEHRRERMELKERIQALEAELGEYKQVHGDITTALLEAQQHAAELKRQAEAEDRRVRAENAERQQAQTDRLKEYIAAIDELQQKLAVFAAGASEELLTYLDRATVLASEYEEEERTIV